MEFPQYRKLQNHPRYYRIDDDRHFTEVYFIGSKRVEHHIEATQYPEMLRIRDMLGDQALYEVITPSAFDEFRKI